MKQKLSNDQIDNLIKKIDQKILELEKNENPEYLLKRALINKGILTDNEELETKQLEYYFTLIKLERDRDSK